MSLVKNRVRRAVGFYKATEKKKVPVGTIWPCGDFSLGYRRVDDSETTIGEEMAYTREYPHAGEGAVRALLDSPAKFSQAPKCAWPRRKYGLKGLTALGRKMVRSGAQLIGERAGDRNCSFLTLTVPPLQENERRLVAETWGETLRQLIQWLSRRLKRRGLPQAVVSASEIQTGRMKASGEGYLHLHLCFPGRLSRSKAWAVRIEDVRAWWEKRLLAVTGLSSLPWTQIKMVPVEKTVAGYLSKYLSKGSHDIRSFIDDLGECSVPAQWWNMSKLARDWVKRAIIRSEPCGWLLEQFVEAALTGAVDVPPYSIRHVDVRYSGALITVGWYGYLKPPVLSDLTAMLKFRLSEIQVG